MQGQHKKKKSIAKWRTQVEISRVITKGIQNDYMTSKLMVVGGREELYCKNLNQTKIKDQ